jgi:hypothetical protein
MYDHTQFFKWEYHRGKIYNNAELIQLNVAHHEYLRQDNTECIRDVLRSLMTYSFV